MAYRHEDDYKRGKLIRGLRKAEKPRVDTEEESLLEVKHLKKIKNFKEGTLKFGSDEASHTQRQRERRKTGRYKDLMSDYNTKGK